MHNEEDHEVKACTDLACIYVRIHERPLHSNLTYRSLSIFLPFFTIAHFEKVVHVLSLCLPQLQKMKS